MFLQSWLVDAPHAVATARGSADPRISSRFIVAQDDVPEASYSIPSSYAALRLPLERISLHGIGDIN